MPHRNGDLAAAAALAGLAALVVEVVSNVPARVVFALPLLLVLPGYSVAAATFGLRRVSVSHLIMLTIGLSLAVAALGGLLLDVMHFGLGRRSWPLFALCVVWSSCEIARRHRASTAGGDGFVSFLRVRRLHVVLLLVAGTIAAGTVAFARTPLRAGDARGYTALWLLPGPAHHRTTLRLGVASAEQHSTRYRLEIWERGRLFEDRENIVLKPGDALRLKIQAPAAHRPAAVTALLFRSNDPHRVYRMARVWLRGGVSGK